MRFTWLAVGALVGLTGCGAPQRGWSENRTRNVTLYADTIVEHKYMQEWLQRSYTAYSALFPEVRPGNVTAVWLRDQPGEGLRFFSPFDDPQAGWTLETVPRARIGHDGLIVLERKDDVSAGGVHRSVRDENVAKLQMAHVFVMKAVPNAPLWLQVGLARYLARYRVHYKGDRWMACFGSPSFDQPIVPGGTSHVTVALTELFGSDWYKYDEKLRSWYEFTAYALVHFMIHGEHGYNGSRFPIFLKALADGKGQGEALLAAYPNILPDEWDDKLELWTHPPGRLSLTAMNPNLVQGLCRRIAPEQANDFKADVRPADPRDIAALLDDLEQVEPFRRHATWMPTDVVAAEAARHPARHRPVTVPPGPEGSSSSPDQVVPGLTQPAPPPR
jgi:hypothetical protein